MRQVGFIVECDENYKWLLRDSSKFNPAAEYRDDIIGADLGKEKPVLDYIREMSKAFPVFIDVGAHVGYYSVRCARYFQKVYSFEPNSTIAPCLKANLALNEIDNVCVYPIALFSENKDDELFIRGGCGHLKTLGNLGEEKFPGIASMTDSVQVKVLRMDVVIKEMMLPFIVKIDTEGADFDVLKGATGLFGNPSIWIVEHHQDVYMLKNRKQDIIDFMADQKMPVVHEFFKESPGDNKLVFSNCL